MYSDLVRDSLADELESISRAGLFKHERIIESPQAAQIIANGKDVLNFCANNYLGLANDPTLIAAAKRGLDDFGLGLASVRFICGTQSIHKELEKRVSAFLETEDTILYNSCFDANGGLFETICSEEDAIISDSLNHASIIDGIRLSKAKRLRYQHSELDDLKRCLEEAKNSRRILIATDSVFSMDGEVADLTALCDLAEQYGAMVMIDECHATGFLGKEGKGAIESEGVLGRVDIITSTFGKALGGAVGGFTSGKREIIELLRQRSRPYLFSNSMPPAVVSATLECLNMLAGSSALRDKLMNSAKFFRSEMSKLGFTLRGEYHPITPVMLGEAQLATEMAKDLLDQGIYVIGFFYPVVPKGEARIRVQISAAHEMGDIERCIEAFAKTGRKHGVIA